MLALLPGDPQELLVLDTEEPCPYLPGQMARLPMRMPIRPLTSVETDARLAEGSRRHGVFWYRPSCRRCRACEPIRLDVARFRESRTHRRTLRKGDAAFRIELGPAVFSADRLALFEKHRRGRGLGPEGRGPITERTYRDFLVDSCVESFELRLFLDGRLVSVSVTDRGEDALSAVYCYYDPTPEVLSFSPGTYSILKQIDLCRRWRLRHLYLGLYIADNRHMSYKGRFVPHERLIDGRWHGFQ